MAVYDLARFTALTAACQHLGRLHLQLVLHVDVGGGDKGVDAPPFPGMLERLPCPVDVLAAGAAQPGDLRPLDLSGRSVSPPRSPLSEAMGNPASITSTFNFCSCFATRSFSSMFMLLPGDCSPSLSVVSNILMSCRSSCFCFFVGAFAMSRYAPFLVVHNAVRSSKALRLLESTISVVSPCRVQDSGVVVC